MIKTIQEQDRQSVKGEDYYRTDTDDKFRLYKRHREKQYSIKLYNTYKGLTRH